MNFEEGLPALSRGGAGGSSSARTQALGTRAALQQASHPNEIWVLDFM